MDGWILRGWMFGIWVMIDHGVILGPLGKRKKTNLDGNCTIMV